MEVKIYYEGTDPRDKVGDISNDPREEYITGEDIYWSPWTSS